MTKKFSHIYLVGCSYMNSFAATKPLTKLTEYFGGELVDLTVAGSSFDFQTRILTEKLWNDEPQCALILWGLTFWHRFELGFRDIKDRKTIDYMSFNPTSMVQNGMAMDFGFHHDEIKLLPEFIFKHKTYVTDPYVSKQFRDIITLTGYLKEKSHEYIIWNYADGTYPKFLKQYKIYNQQFKKDKGFIDLENFKLNDWLFDNGVQPDPNDLKMVPKNICHPVVDNNLKSIMSDWIINKYKEIYE